MTYASSAKSVAPTPQRLHQSTMKGWTVPNYDFKCKVCGSVQELYKTFGDDTLPVCCEQSMEKVFYPTPVKFNTGGFYSTGG
jgi:predicted nucleic acid-binding Zn ribbon protein